MTQKNWLRRLFPQPIHIHYIGMNTIFCVCSAAGKKRESITYTKCEKASCPKGLVHSYFDMEKLLLLLFEKCPLRIVLQQVLLPYIWKEPSLDNTSDILLLVVVVHLLLRITKKLDYTIFTVRGSNSLFSHLASYFDVLFKYIFGELRCKIQQYIWDIQNTV